MNNLNSVGCSDQNIMSYFPVVNKNYTYQGWLRLTILYIIAQFWYISKLDFSPSISTKLYD